MHLNEPCVDGPAGARHWLDGSPGRNAPSEAACRERCAADGRCKAYVYGYGYEKDTLCRAFARCDTRYPETGSATGVKEEALMGGEASSSRAWRWRGL